MWKERAGRGVRPKMSVGSTMEAIQKRGKLVVGTKMDQPLFGLKGFSGKPEGFDVEIAKKVAWSIFGDANAVEFVEAVSKNREPFIKEGKVDIVTATYTINDVRKKEVDGSRRSPPTTRCCSATCRRTVAPTRWSAGPSPRSRTASG